MIIHFAKHLNPKLFDKDVEKESTRDGFGRGLVTAGERNPQVVVLCADLAESTRIQLFAERFPERFVETGVAEQNLITLASGMSAMGKIPFASSYASFSPGRNWEQIRTTICLNERKVIIVGAHAGISVGPDGATHQALEDLALMRVLPKITVVSPCDSIEAEKATLASLDFDGPIYLRLHREKTAQINTRNSPFKIGQAEILKSGRDATIIGCGPLLSEALSAAKDLEKEEVSIRVINMHTIKPLDIRSVLEAGWETGAIVTVEEHQVNGGLGGAIAEVLVENLPIPLIRVGVQDKFGESGKPEELLVHYGLKARDIKAAVRSVIERKNAGKTKRGSH